MNSITEDSISHEPKREKRYPTDYDRHKYNGCDPDAREETP